MEKKLIKGTYKCNYKNDTSTETFELEYQEDALIAYKEIIKEYNNEELRRKKISSDYPVGLREVISAEWVGKDIIKYCEFDKVNLVTIHKKGLTYDEYKCIHCNKLVKRIGLNDIPISKCKVKNDN